jgi:hypothetical protein
MAYLNSTTINNISVTIKVDKSNYISFYLDGKLDKENIKNKVAITKWLLKEFKQIGKDFLYLFAIPFEKDGYGEVRKIIFNKLGFTPITRYGVTTLVWFKKDFLHKEEILTRFKEGEFEEEDDDEYFEDTGEFEEEDDEEIISWDSLKF